MNTFFADQLVSGSPAAWAPQIGDPSISLTPGAASLTVTGFAPTISRSANQAVSPAAAGITLTGYAPVLSQTGNQALTPGASALAISGFAPTLTQSGNLGLQPGAAVLAISGFAPAISQTTGSGIQPGPASLSIAGFAPTLAQTANVSLSPGASPIVITGYVPSIVNSGEQGQSLITLTEAKQYLDMALSVAMPDFVVQAAINKTTALVPALVDAGYSEPDQQMIQCMAVALIALGGNPRRLSSQSAPSGASRSFKVNAQDLQALRRSLMALDAAGVMSAVVGPDPTSNTLFMVTC